MESHLQNTIVCFVLLAVVNGNFDVPPSVSGRIGAKTRLDCRLNDGYRWYVISWYKLNSDGTKELLVSLPSDTKTPDWSSSDSGYRRRMRPKISIEKFRTEFNLELTHLSCEDEGQAFQCIIIGQTGTMTGITYIHTHSEPKRPEIHYDYLFIEMNSSFEIECQVDVGFPPKRIVWMYKSAFDHDFQVMEVQRPQVQVSRENCHIIVRKPVLIFMNRKSSGAVYRCTIEGYDYTDQQYFDEVTVQLPKVEVETISNQRGYREDAKCPDVGCIAESNYPSNTATSLNIAVRTALLAAILVSL
ncbi:uncharacterized protein LOC121380434 [Gigantopelta aegis]|uniref:uncharacterized protein LOC121380434 n=1 Tax=Gigantopelta aegis TaxID=1735272 RepID=UPI001B88C68B|nr:uncharacterized protein LOC121380434 [Gigantopelta aegis]